MHDAQDIRAGQVQVNLKKEYCNSEMVCDSCQNKQKNRAFCYFCSAVQRLPQCAECGRTKCMVADCTVSHAGKSATGQLTNMHTYLHTPLGWSQRQSLQCLKSSRGGLQSKYGKCAQVWAWLGQSVTSAKPGCVTPRSAFRRESDLSASALCL